MGDELRVLCGEAVWGLRGMGSSVLFYSYLFLSIHFLFLYIYLYLFFSFFIYKSMDTGIIATFLVLPLEMMNLVR